MIQKKALTKDGSYLANVHDSGSWNVCTFGTRFLIICNISTFQIIDLFHPLTRILNVYILKNETDQESSISEKKFEPKVVSIFALNLNTILMYFKADGADYLGVCEIDFERSVVVVKQTTILVNRASSLVWHLQSHPANLYEGIIIEASCFNSPRYYLVVKMETNGKLQVSQLSVPMRMRVCGYFDGLLYGLLDTEFLLMWGPLFTVLSQPIDLIKFSISTGQYVQEPTINWEITNDKEVKEINMFSYAL
ncbi:hypothetical protein M3Y95_00715700 [Aphelenchoides besseyi]|nr:hypothetical protein M3Y95_00715700 [Aphelenchoides besseyi]